MSLSWCTNLHSERSQGRCGGGEGLRWVGGRSAVINVALAFAVACHGEGAPADTATARVDEAFIARRREPLLFINWPLPL